VFLQPFSAAYIPLPLKEENFVSITPLNADKCTIFVDGGNAEILRTPDCSLQFLRFAAVAFSGTKRFSMQKKEGYVLVSSLHAHGAMHVTLTGYGDLRSLAPLTLSYDDQLLLHGNQRTKLQICAELFRSLYEIQFAEEVLKNFSAREKNPVLVLDRALLPGNVYEEKAFASLYSATEQTKAVICGLNKTTNLLTNTGESIVQYLSRFGKKGCWLYYPFFSSYDPKHRALLSFVKFHSLSEHIFRFEMHSSQEDDLYTAASLLASLSNDGAFLGYPYGLIAVDQFARVSNREKESLQLLFLNHTAKTSFSTTALDAHDILDGIGARKKTSIRHK
jgi:hypothetical protein